MQENETWEIKSFIQGVLGAQLIDYNINNNNKKEFYNRKSTAACCPFLEPPGGLLHSIRRKNPFCIWMRPISCGVCAQCMTGLVVGGWSFIWLKIFASENLTGAKYYVNFNVVVIQNYVNLFETNTYTILSIAWNNILTFQ